MNLEGLTLKLVKDHLEQELLGGKIYRVFMPTPHSLLLMIKRERDTTALLAELNGGSPALYIPKQLPENPDVPPGYGAARQTVGGTSAAIPGPRCYNLPCE